MAGALVGCGSGSTTPTTAADIAGTWDYAGTVSSTSLQTSCDFTGTIAIVQSGHEASGTYNASTSCTGPTGTVTQPGSGNISAGKVSGSHVSFHDDGGCTYSGSITGDPTNAMSGTVSCLRGIQGTNYTFSGTWSAQR
jgi:hypothetical protein